MRQTLLSLLIVCVLFSLGNVTLAQESKASNNPKAKTSNKGVVKPPTVLPFDVNTEKLPPHYKGTDIVALYSLLAKKLPLKKKEFETTADYEQKIVSALTGDIYAFRVIENVHIFVRSLKIQPYDADRQKLKIELETRYLSKYTFEDYRASIIIRDIKEGSRTYVGSNAFGVKRLVYDSSATQYGIALVNQTDFGTSGHEDEEKRYKIKTPLTSVIKISMEIDVSPDKAMTLKDNVGVIILCRLARYHTNSNIRKEGNELFFENNFYSPPTIGTPTSSLHKRKYINVEVQAVWIYDFRTGEIILKKQLKETKETAPPGAGPQETRGERITCTS